MGGTVIGIGVGIKYHTSQTMPDVLIQENIAESKSSVNTTENIQEKSYWNF